MIFRQGSWPYFFFWKKNSFWYIFFERQATFVKFHPPLYTWIYIPKYISAIALLNADADLSLITHNIFIASWDNTYSGTTGVGGIWQRLPAFQKIYIKNYFFSKKKVWPWSLAKNHTWLQWKILNGQSKWFIGSTKVHSPLGEFYEFFLAKNTKTLITQWILWVQRNWRDKFTLNLT